MITDCTFLSQSFLGHCSLMNLLRMAEGNKIELGYCPRNRRTETQLHDVLLIFNLLSYFLYLLLTLNLY